MDLFDLSAKITLDSSEYERGLSQASGKLSGFGAKLKTGLANVAKVSAAAIGVASAGVAAIVKSSVDAYADYEQLVGGVETLFSNLEGTVSAAPEVLANAERAYKTAGLSANEYMETVTSFSAALVSSLDGDYSKAAQISDMAITDMADNANKMGTSMESIQNAYQGFAKQNYTMLDNLKLGYGGTKSEMERLLKDAQKITGVKYDISNLSDVYEAIHVVQTEMGITGTTAKEAAATISGSLGMTKAAWENLVRAFGDKDADLSKYFGELVTSAKTAFKNILPVAEQALSGIVDVIAGIAPVIAEELPKLITDLLPGVVSAATSFVGGIVKAIPQIMQSLWDTLVVTITQVGGFKIGKALLNIEEVVKDSAGSWGDAIKTVLGKIDFQKIFDGVADAVNFVADAIKWLSSNADTLIPILSGAAVAAAGLFAVFKGAAIISVVKKAILGVVAAFKAFSLVLMANPIGIVIALLAGLAAALVLLWKKNETFRKNVIKIWTAIRTFFSTTFKAIKKVFSDGWDSIKKNASTKWNEIKNFLSKTWVNIKATATTVWDAIRTTISTAIDKAKSAVTSTIGKLKSSLATAWANIKSTASTMWNNVKSAITAPIETAKATISTTVENIKSALSQAWDNISSTATQAWEGIKSAITKPIEDAKESISKIWDDIVGWFSGDIKLNFKLPTISLGWKNWNTIFGPIDIPWPEIKWEKKALDNPLMFTGATLFGAGEAGDEMLYGRSALMDDIKEAVKGTGRANINITVNAAPGMDENTLADMVARKLQQQLDRRQAVWA